MPRAISNKHKEKPLANVTDHPVAGAKHERQVSPESMELAELFWKYFQTEIRETLLEIQESPNDENPKSQQKLSDRN